MASYVTAPFEVSLASYAEAAGAPTPTPTPTFRLDNVVLVNLGGKNLFWSNLAKKSGFDHFLQVKLGFDQKNWFWSI